MWEGVLNMNVVPQVIEKYLSAVEQVHGKEYREQTVVESRGGTAIYLKKPDQEATIISLSQLEMMIHGLESRMEQ